MEKILLNCRLSVGRSIGSSAATMDLRPRGPKTRRSSFQRGTGQRNIAVVYYQSRTYLSFRTDGKTGQSLRLLIDTGSDLAASTLLEDLQSETAAIQTASDPLDPIRPGAPQYIALADCNPNPQHERTNARRTTTLLSALLSPVAGAAQASFPRPVEHEQPGQWHCAIRTGRFAYVSFATLVTGGFQATYRKSFEFQTAIFIFAAIRHIQVGFGQKQRAKPDAVRCGREEMSPMCINAVYKTYPATNF